MTVRFWASQCGVRQDLAVSSTGNHLYAPNLALTNCQELPTVAYYDEGERASMLTATQTCERLGVSRETLRKLIKSGELRAMKIGPERAAHWRISEEAVADYIKRRTDQASAS
jgi:excisionase family DNA binding protein